MDHQPYRDRRGILMEQLGKGLILVRGSGPEGVNPDFFYLTGIREARGALLLAPAGTRIETGRVYPGPDYVRGRMVQQILFLPTLDPLAARWGEDSAATVESVTAEAAGVDAVFPTGGMDEVLTAAFRTARVLHYVRETPPALAGPDDAAAEFVDRIRRRFIDIDVRDGAPAVHEMRRSKDEVEVAALDRAVALTGQALDRVFTSVTAGMHEYQVEAEISRVYRANGAGHAFESIVASGANANSLHYCENSGPIGAGQLLLIDTGASVDGYHADITRTMPVDGRFTPRQREVYEVVLGALEGSIERCRPGVLLGDLHAQAYEQIAAAGLSDFFPHGLGHHLGLETHDVGDLYRPLRPGTVITVEPGVYLPAEGFGVRIEDDVVVTDDGCRVLSGSIPKTVEEIERRMAERS